MNISIFHKVLLFFGCLMSLLLGVYSCKERHPVGGPHYYRSWVGYQIPFQPEGPLTQEKAKKIGNYYEAYFDNKGKMLSFRKYTNGEIEWTDKYSYRVNGVIEKREMSKSSGEVTIQYFDEQGKIIQQ